MTQDKILQSLMEVTVKGTVETPYYIDNVCFSFNNLKVENIRLINEDVILIARACNPKAKVVEDEYVIRTGNRSYIIDGSGKFIDISNDVDVVYQLPNERYMLIYDDCSINVINKDGDFIWENPCKYRFMVSTKGTHVFAVNPDTFNTTTEFCNIIDLETGLPALPQDFEFGVENPTLEYTKETEEVVKVDGKEVILDLKNLKYIER
jgi:hypothetical protein